MLPTHHALVAAAVAIPLKRRGWTWRDVGSFVAASVLIDADHYLGYAWEQRDFSLRRAYYYHRTKYRKPRRWTFNPHWPPLWFTPYRAVHATPVLFLVFLAARRWPFLAPAAYGLLLHRVQDELWGCFA